MKKEGFAFDVAFTSVLKRDQDSVERHRDSSSELSSAMHPRIRDECILELFKRIGHEQPLAFDPIELPATGNTYVAAALRRRALRVPRRGYKLICKFETDSATSFKR